MQKKKKKKSEKIKELTIVAIGFVFLYSFRASYRLQKSFTVTLFLAVSLAKLPKLWV